MNDARTGTLETDALGLTEKEHIFIILLTTVLFLGCVFPFVRAANLQSTDTIELEEFRWTTFPIKVLVDMNQWSQPEYAGAVREALDSWVKSIWNYTNTYNDTSLTRINYAFYLSNVNTTSNYDVFISFTANKIPPGTATVGLTTYSWDPINHQSIAPIDINITTFSGTATTLFVEDVVMHEFGHALGLGHASSQDTLNGPELMYYASSKNEVVYPSTLDVYGLTRLYMGNYGQNVALPSSIPYVELTEGDIPPPQTYSFGDYSKYTPLLIILFLVIVIAAVLGLITRETRTEEALEPPPPPAPEDV